MTHRDTNNERQLVASIKKNDRQAMKAAYIQYAPMVAGVCRRYPQTQADIDDIVQETFVKVFSHIDKFDMRDEGSFGAWIRRITVNGAIEHLRHSYDMVSVETSATYQTSHRHTPLH